MSSKERDKNSLSFRGIPRVCPIMYFKQRGGGHSPFSKQHVALGWWSLFKQVEGERTESICDGGEGAFRRKKKKAPHTHICFKSPISSKRVPSIRRENSESRSLLLLLSPGERSGLPQTFFWAEKGRISSFPFLITECCYKRIRVSCIRANKKDRRRCDTLIPIPCRRRLDFRALRLQKNLFAGERRAAGTKTILFFFFFHCYYYRSNCRQFSYSKSAAACNTCV